VDLFEVLNGFGVMHNVYDRVDLGANAAGIALAVASDVLANRVNSGRSKRVERANARSTRPTV
jgi:hypothetical protein